jgi:hypothetical protein
MSVSEGMKQRNRSWKVRMGGLCTGNPRLMGNRNPAVLCCNAQQALSLEATYDPPGNIWFMLVLVAAFLAVVFVATILGAPGAAVGCVGGGAIPAVYFSVLFWRKRKATLDVSKSTDAVVDKNHGRMAFLMPLENKTYWIVLAFSDGFAEGVDAIRDVMGPKFRTAQIGTVNRQFVWLSLAIVLIFVLAFAYFMVAGTMALRN